MVEVPAAALAVRSLAAGLDFVSIGTNDLTQYAMAADRGNDAVADLADPFDPAVLRLVDLVGRERPDGVTVAVCGELASRPEAVSLLLGLGVEELSCVPAAVPEVKAAVRRIDLGRARDLAGEALRASDAAGVRALLAAG
jgi:phosphoenolpyruvate-protein kinase (PTS system EI component)